MNWCVQLHIVLMLIQRKNEWSRCMACVQFHKMHYDRLYSHPPTPPANYFSFSLGKGKYRQGLDWRGQKEATLHKRLEVTVYNTSGRQFS